MRVLDSEHAALLKQAEMESKKKGKINAEQKIKENKKNKWKKQSEELRAIVKDNIEPKAQTSKRAI